MTVWLKKYHLGPLIGLIALVVMLAIASSQFFTTGNISNLLLQTSVNALLTVGMTFVILTAGIDLSVGSTLALSAAIAAGLMQGHMNIWLASVIGLSIGTAAGMINGLFIAYGRLAPFIVTLGTMTLFRGLTQVYTQGTPVFNIPNSFSNLGAGMFVGIPVPILIALLVFILAWVVLHRSTMGRRIFAIGGNEQVAYLAGIPVKRYLLIVYMVSGFLAALAGLVLTSRLGTAEPTAGTGYELDAITAVVLGGTSLFGGEGRVLGTLVGALILGVINNGLNILNVNSFYQDVVKGAIILLAIMLDRKKSTGR